MAFVSDSGEPRSGPFRTHFGEMSDLRLPDSGSVDLTIVVAAMNAAKTIRSQVASLLDQQWKGSWEVIVADNGSTDGTRSILEVVARTDRRLRLIDASGERGPSYARNAGVKAANGMAIAFCDADDVAGDGWVAAMGNALRRQPFVTGPLEEERLNQRWVQNVYGSARTSGLQYFAGVFPYGPSANLGIQRRLFDESGGFDPALRVGEDIELCLRMWHAGTPVHFVDDAVMHYRNRADMRTLWRQSVSYGVAGVEIASRLFELGHSIPSRSRGPKNWIWLIRSLPSLRVRSATRPLGRRRWRCAWPSARKRAIPVLLPLTTPANRLWRIHPHNHELVVPSMRPCQEFRAVFTF